MAIREQKLPSARLDATTRRGFNVALVIDLILWMVWVFSIKRLPPEIPLWYSLPYGQSLLANKEWSIIIPVIATGGVLINLFLAWCWRRLTAVLMAFMAWGSTLAALLMLIAYVHIVILVL